MNKNGFLLPKELYYETLWFIRRYDDLNAQYAAIFGHSKERNAGGGNAVGDPTGVDALKCAELSKQLDAIINALELVPAEYRKGVFDNVVYRKPYPIYAGTATWKRWRQRFIYYVARERRWL